MKTACQNGVSNLSDLLAVSVKYELENAPKSKDLIIKLLPHDPFSRFFVTEAQFDLREIKFYTNVSTNCVNNDQDWVIVKSNLTDSTATYRIPKEAFETEC